MQAPGTALQNSQSARGSGIESDDKENCIATSATRNFSSYLMNLGGVAMASERYSPRLRQRQPSQTHEPYSVKNRGAQHPSLSIKMLAGDRVSSSPSGCAGQPPKKRLVSRTFWCLASAIATSTRRRLRCCAQGAVDASTVITATTARAGLLEHELCRR